MHWLLYCSIAGVLGCGTYEGLSPEGNCIQCSSLFPDCYRCEFIGSPNQVQNGGFETPTIPSGDSYITSTIDGWGVGASSTNIHVKNDGSVPEGSQFIEFDSSDNIDIEQTLNLLRGREYSLSFAYAPYEGTSAAKSGLEVYVNSVLFDTLARDGGASRLWTTHSYLFTATAQTTISFGYTGTSTNSGCFLDDVRVEIADDELKYEVKYYYDPATTCGLCGAGTYVRPECEVALLPTDPVTRCFSSIEGGAVKPKRCFGYYPMF